MSLRDLVAGGAACAPDEAEGSSSAGPANPLSRLASSLMYEPNARAAYGDAGPSGEGSRPLPPPPGPRLRPPPARYAHPAEHAAWQREFMAAQPMLPPGEDAHFERAFGGPAGPAPPPQELQALESRAYHHAREMYGDNDLLVQQEVEQFMNEIISGVVPPPPVAGPAPVPRWRAPDPRFHAPLEPDFEAAFAQGAAAPGPVGQLHPQQRMGHEEQWANDFASLEIGSAAASASRATAELDAAEFANNEGKLFDGGELAEEFIQEQSQRREDWADELAEEESWGDKFTSLENEETYEEALASYLAGRESETDYEFSTENPYLQDSDALGTAEKLLEQGEMVQAALALEAAVQHEPKNSRAWFLLGEAQAECDNDVKAIAALKRCTEIGEDQESHRDALLSLGISYANELNQTRALDYLRRWIDMHPEYKHFKAGIQASDPSNEFAAHGELLQRMLAAVASHPQSAELHSVVGVLYNLSREYEEGQSAFLRAIEINGSDYKLWNRLGATFANGDNAAEALRAYRTAVDLKPGYVRAWVNVGTAYANQGKMEHASRFYLRSLALNPDASHVWSYLRTVLLAMKRMDLLHLVEERNLEEFKQALPS